MPIFKVQVSFEIDVVVQAEDEDHAHEVAKENWAEMQDECSGGPDVFVVGEIKSLEALPADWDGRCLPYGGDGRTRIWELLDKPN